MRKFFKKIDNFGLKTKGNLTKVYFWSTYLWAENPCKNRFFYSERSEAEGRASLVWGRALFVARELGWKQKKVDKKKRYDDDATDVFCPPLFVLQIWRKCQFLKKISKFWNTTFFFWEREKFQDFVIFYKKFNFGMDFPLITKYSKSRIWSNFL